MAKAKRYIVDAKGILQALNAGESPSTIAVRFNTTARTVRKIAVDHGMGGKPGIRRRFLTIHEQTTIRRMVKEGEHVSAIARYLGIGHGTVWSYCQDHDLKPVKGKSGVPTRITPEAVEKIIAWRAEKVTWPTIARRLGIGPSAIYRKAGQLGLLKTIKNEPLDNRTLDQIWGLWHDQGLRARQVALISGIAEDQVQSVINRWTCKGLAKTRRKPTNVAA